MPERDRIDPSQTRKDDSVPEVARTSFTRGSAAGRSDRRRTHREKRPPAAVPCRRRLLRSGRDPEHGNEDMIRAVGQPELPGFRPVRRLPGFRGIPLFHEAGTDRRWPGTLSLDAVRVTGDAVNGSKWEDVTGHDPVGRRRIIYVRKARDRLSNLAGRGVTSS